MKEEMAKVFDRPTPYILNSSYVQMATPDKLSARIAPENKRDSVGVDPQKILQAQEFGARAVTSAASLAFRRAGILMPGWQIAIPSTPYPGSSDGRGNLRGPFVPSYQLLCRLGRAGLQRQHDRQAQARYSSRHQKRPPAGRYFVSHGRLRGQHSGCRYMGGQRHRRCGCAPRPCFSAQAATRRA